jgi:hypothetical protein
MLQPGEYLLEYSPDLSILNDDLSKLGVINSIGKTYHVKRKVVKELVKKVKEKRNFHESIYQLVGFKKPKCC